jgi:hypothetical protein
VDSAAAGAGRLPLLEGELADDSAMPGAGALSSIKAERVTIVDFPDRSMDLLSVYRTNTGGLTAAPAR